MVTQSDKITVFYDGACGLCAKEIAHYKEIAPENIFEWIDITRNSESFTALGYSLSDGLKALHAQDKDHNIHIGVDAFLVIWREMKGWKLLAFFVGLPIVRHIAGFAYRHFARWRFKKLGYQD